MTCLGFLELFYRQNKIPDSCGQGDVISVVLQEPKTHSSGKEEDREVSESAPKRYLGSAGRREGTVRPVY
jgi:hypothetical protein